MVHIKAGSFIMGSNSGSSNEKPVHRVTISKDFYIGKYEVTFAEYDKFCNATGRRKPNDEGWGRGKRPVMNVSWDDAKAFISWLSQITNKTYRLPTEAEWEYVARAGSTTKYSFGDSANLLASFAWYKKNSKDKTHKVGEKEPNPWGVYDIHGNVWEWCEDWNYSYKNYRNKNYSIKRTRKVRRGGSWHDNRIFLRSASRSFFTATNSSRYVGFRVVLER